MTWWLWLIVVLLAVGVFGLGMFTAWTLRTKRDLSRPDLFLGVFFALIALAVTADTIQLQVQFHEHVNQNMATEQADLACNQAQNNALINIGNARRGVDEAALTYDQALQAFLAIPVVQREPNNPIVINLVTTLNWLVAARKVATKAYANNPFPHCG